MKIYSTQRYPKWNLIPKFMGKDIWVLCHHFNDNGCHMGNYYVRFLRESVHYGRTFYYVNTISPQFVDNYSSYQDRFDEEFKSRVFREYPVVPDAYDIVTYPAVETITTDELLSILNQEGEHSSEEQG